MQDAEEKEKKTKEELDKLKNKGGSEDEKRRLRKQLQGELSQPSDIQYKFPTKMQLLKMQYYTKQLILLSLSALGQ